MRYFPSGLQSSPFTEPLWPVIAPRSVHTSFMISSEELLEAHLLQPPDQPHANASVPFRAHSPPTKPPSLWPPTSPNRCRLTQMEDDSSVVGSNIVEGDQRMTEESVEADNSVGFEVIVGRQASEVIPASWPTRRASNVIENCRELKRVVKADDYEIVVEIPFWASFDSHNMML